MATARTTSRSAWMAGTSAAAVTLAIAAAGITPATASGSDVIRRGGCSGSAVWKIKASPQDGRIEVEGEVDSNRNGQTWRWRIVHNGSVSAHGKARTKAPSGSFDVRRVIVDMAGTDTIGWRARHPATGQTCRGSLRF